MRAKIYNIRLRDISIVGGFFWCATSFPACVAFLSPQLYLASLCVAPHFFLLLLFLPLSNRVCF
jgi:hypothetical protein